MNRSASNRLRMRCAAFGCGTLLSMVAAAPAAAESDKIIIAEVFGPRAGWALESDDAFVLSKAGCLEMLTRTDFDGSLKPGLATSWVQSTPTDWDFTLRQGVKFADGKAFDAAAVVGALTHLLHVAAPPRSFSPKLVSAVKALDDRTVRITTPEPSVLVPLRMSSPNTGILSPAAYKADHVDPFHACTGPYTAVEEIPRQSLKLERNAAYWDRPAGYAKAEMRFVPDGQVRGTLVQTGEAQVATVLPVTVLREPPKTVTVLSADLPRVASLYLNDARPPFNDVRVRQAIQAALDAAAISKSVYEGLAKPAIGPFLPEEAWAPAGARPVAQDVKRSGELLAAAGIKPNSLSFELLAYTERPELEDLASVIQAELADIGVTVTIRAASYSSLEPDLLAGKFDAMLLSRSHLTDVPDPGAYLVNDYSCKGTYNISHFCDPAVDAKLNAALTLTEASQRFPIYAEVASQLQKDAVTVFLIREQQRDGIGTAVAGFRTHPLGHYILTNRLAPAVK